MLNLFKKKNIRVGFGICLCDYMTATKVCGWAGSYITRKKRVKIVILNLKNKKRKTDCNTSEVTRIVLPLPNIQQNSNGQICQQCNNIRSYRLSNCILFYYTPSRLYICNLFSSEVRSFICF